MILLKIFISASFMPFTKMYGLLSTPPEGSPISRLEKEAETLTLFALLRKLVKAAASV